MKIYIGKEKMKLGVARLKPNLSKQSTKAKEHTLIAYNEIINEV